jgi:hypothetical protein
MIKKFKKKIPSSSIFPLHPAKRHLEPKLFNLENIFIQKYYKEQNHLSIFNLKCFKCKKKPKEKKSDEDQCSYIKLYPILNEKVNIFLL